MKSQGRDATSGRVTGEEPASDHVCDSIQAGFLEYLDGTLDGHTMAQLAAHMEVCTTCSWEFKSLCSLQSALAELGPIPVPIALQAQLRDALAGELRQGHYRSPLQKLRSFGANTFAPMCLRAAGGFGAALVLIGTTIWFVGSAAPVQANDDRLADLHPPHFLYSMEEPLPIAASNRVVAVVVEAKVNAQGRVYDYTILQGPRDSGTRARIEANLLASIFEPATVFGEPVPGHAMITYTAVSVHG